MRTTTPPQRYYDEERDRLVTTSPSLLMVWKGKKPGRWIAGPFKLPAPVHTRDELIDAYAEWMEQGEPK
jgi:hypothetical protein